MTFDLATTGGIDPEISAAIVIADRLTPLKDALGIGDLTPPEIQLFAMVAHHTGLDPFTKQIYAIKRRGKVVHQTGIDGYRSTAERTKEYAGSDEPTFETCDCGEAPKDHPKLARVVVHRLMANGHMIDQVGVARWHELYPGAGEDGFMWRKRMHGQLAKCAEAVGLRQAFPRVLGGVYIAEEMEQADTIEGTATVLPSAAERIAARRQAAEAETTGPGEPDATDDPASEPTAEPSAPRLTKPQFVNRLALSGIDPNHAATLRLVMFPDATADLNDEQRGALWVQLEAEKAEAEAVPA